MRHHPAWLSHGPPRPLCRPFLDGDEMPVMNPVGAAVGLAFIVVAIITLYGKGIPDYEKKAAIGVIVVGAVLIAASVG